MILVYRLGFLALLLALWTLAAQQFGRNVVPTPLATFEAAQRLIAQGRLQTALAASLKVYLSGYALAVICAIPVGVLMGGFRLLGKTLEIYVFALAATPRGMRCRTWIAPASKAWPGWITGRFRALAGTAWGRWT